MSRDTNKEVQKAQEQLEYLSGDEELKKLEELRIKAEIDERSALYGAEMKGREEGRKEGKEEERKEIVANMIKKKIPIEVIIDVTGLSEKEIKEIERRIVM